MATYLLTWNPKKKTGSEFPAAIRHLGRGQRARGNWSTHSHQIVAGDVMYLLRQGAEPRGIVGRGRATGVPERGRRWNPKSKRQPHYVPLEWECLLDPLIAPGPLLLAELIAEGLSTFSKKLQSSGIAIPAGEADLLGKLWRGHTRGLARPTNVGAGASREPAEPVPSSPEDELRTTDKEALKRVRTAQAAFRARVMTYESRCRISGIANPDHLVAGHIKPWSKCRTAAEKLDGANGLMLCPNADHLFGEGWITFKDDGTVIRSPLITPKELQRFGVQLPLNVGPFRPQQARYLEYHRRKVFKEE